MEKILIIEDHKDIRDNLEEILELEGYNVLTASDGIEGIKKVRQGMPNLVLCDLLMPYKNGYEVFEETQPILQAQKIPFIFLTASAQERDILKGKMSGADAYITKPFHPNYLLKVIKTFLAQKDD